MGKLVYIDSKSHTRGIPYGEKEVPPFYVLSKIQVKLFFKFCYLLTPMRMDNARILMVPQISLSSDGNLPSIFPALPRISDSC